MAASIYDNNLSIDATIEPISHFYWFTGRCQMIILVPYKFY